MQTKFDYATGKVNIVREIRYSEGERANVRCYGADDVREGVAIMHLEGVDVSITATPPTPPVPASRGRHLQEGVHRAGQEVLLRGLRRRHGPYAPIPITWPLATASYGMTDTMGRMHSDAQFAGSPPCPPTWK